MIHGNIPDYSVPHLTILLRQKPHKVSLRQEHKPPFCLAGKILQSQRLRGYPYFRDRERGGLRASKFDEAGRALTGGYQMFSTI